MASREQNERNSFGAESASGGVGAAVGAGST